MAEIGKIRIRIPPTIKRGDVVRVRSLVMHPMEIVRRDKDGKPIDANYHFIHKVSVRYNDREILQVDTTQSVSENPFLTFAFKATEPGTLTLSFLDTHGGKYEGTAEITFS